MHRILVAAPRWLRAHGVPRTPSQLVRHPCLVQVTPVGAVVRWLLRRTDRETNDRANDAASDTAVDETVDVRGPVRSNAPIALRDLAVDGAGIAYLPDWLVANDLARGRLRRVLPRWASPAIMAWAIHRAELRGAPRVRAFVETMSRGAFPNRGGAQEPVSEG